jgi:hypothetical protein
MNPREETMATSDIIERYFDCLSKNTGWEAFLSDGMVFTSYTSPIKQVTGRDTYLESTRGFYSMIGTVQVRDLIVDGDRACAFTHYELRPPSGDTFGSDVAELFTVKNDKIDSFSIYFDSAPFSR